LTSLRAHSRAPPEVSKRPPCWSFAEVRVTAGGIDLAQDFVFEQLQVIDLEGAFAD
jgi:hypothetical protein